MKAFKRSGKYSVTKATTMNNWYFIIDLQTLKKSSSTYVQIIQATENG